MNVKKAIVASLALGLVSGSASANKFDDDFVAYGRVTEVEPVYRTVETSRPVERCYDRTVRSRRHGAGTVVGAVVGGVLGNKFGRGHRNRDLATVAGALIGGVVGHDVDRNHGHRDRYRNVRQCETEYVSDYREELTGYRVHYKYRGHDYETFTRQAPGERIAVRVAVEPLPEGYAADYEPTRHDRHDGDDFNDDQEWY